MIRWIPLVLLLLLSGCGEPEEGPPVGDGGSDAAQAEGTSGSEEGQAAVESPPVVAPGGTDIWMASLSIDGTSLRVGQATNLTDRPERYDNQPQFLPDGTGFLYTAGDAEGRTDIFRYPLPAGPPQRLTRTPEESEYSPTPLSDGGFSVIRVEEDGTQRLWRFEADGGDPQLLLPDLAPVGYQGWIDGDRVALFVLGQPATLHVADVSSQEVERAFDGIGPSIQAIPGREGVTFVETGEGERWIREYDASTGESRRIVRTPGEGSDHAWTPSGVLLAASGEHLFALFPGESEWQEVARPGPEGIVWSRIAVSPDGEWIALVGAPLS